MGFYRFCRLLLLLVVLIGNVQALQASSLREIIRQVGPRASKQITELVTRGQVAAKKICIAGLCAISLALPVQADQQLLTTDAELADTRGTGSLFTVPRSKRDKSMGEMGFTSKWFLGTGVFAVNGDELTTFRFGASGKSKNFAVYFKSAIRTNTEMLDGIDSLKIKPHMWFGGDILLMPREGQTSIGYADINFFTSGKLIPHKARAYLAKKDFGPVQLAVLGGEYFDLTPSAGLADVDTARGYFASLYRAGLAHKLVEKPGLSIALKLNSALGVGFDEVGEVWQDELSNWAGGADLHYALLHEGGGALKFKLGDEGRISFAVFAKHINTVDGQLKTMNGMEGEYELSHSTLGFSSLIKIIPEDDVSFEAIYKWYRQQSEGSLDGNHYQRDEDGHRGRFAVHKTFN